MTAQMLNIWYADAPMAAWSAPIFDNAKQLAAAGNKQDAALALHEILNSDGLGSILRLQAWNGLREMGYAPGSDIEKELCGVIIEVGMDEGLDVLAGYADGSARYLNYSGKLIVYEGGPGPVATRAAALLEACEPIVQRIGVWEQPRPASPATGAMRLSMLTPNGLYFGQASMGVLSGDPMAGPAVQAGVALMSALIELKP